MGQVRDLQAIKSADDRVKITISAQTGSTPNVDNPAGHGVATMNRDDVQIPSSGIMTKKEVTQEYEYR